MPFREDAGDLDTISTGCHQHLGFKKGMAIASLNINGSRSHHDEIKLLLNDQGKHILALNETKLDASISKELTEISSYQKIRLDRTCNGGCVAFYVRDSIKMTPRDDVPSDGLELLCVETSHPKASPFLLLLGTDHQETLLTPLISLTRFPWQGGQRNYSP